MILKSLTYDSIRKNIGTYGSNKLKGLINLAESEDLQERKLKSLLVNSIRRYKFKKKETCWINEDLFRENLLRNLRLSKEERKQLNRLFKIERP
jgi:hypothetical protein